MTVRPTVTPATKSPNASSPLYFGNHLKIGNLLHNIFVVQTALAFCPAYWAAVTKKLSFCLASSSPGSSITSREFVYLFIIINIAPSVVAYLHGRSTDSFSFIKLSRREVISNFPASVNLDFVLLLLSIATIKK